MDLEPHSLYFRVMLEEIANRIDQHLIIDLVGFLSSLIYLHLIIKQKRSAWYWSILGSTLFAYSCFSSQLYIQSALYVFYVAIAFYGLHRWREGKSTPQVNSMPLSSHLIIISVSVIFGLTMGYIFATYTDQRLPYLDGLITLFAIGTTLLVVSKNRENWLYWMVINAVSMYLYAAQDLWVLVLMSGILLIVAVKGYLSWK